MRRITLTGTALAVLLLLLLGGVAIAGATPAATPDKARRSTSTCSSAPSS